MSLQDPVKAPRVFMRRHGINRVLRSSGELRGEYKHVLTFFHFSDHCVVYTCFECSLIFIFEPACSILSKRAQD